MLRPLLAVFFATLVALAWSPEAATAQDRGTVRIGVSLGGTGFVGLSTEYRRGNWSGELTLGTISFREIAVAVSGKRYVSRGAF